jgi:hypothetical protein
MKNTIMVTYGHENLSGGISLNEFQICNHHCCLIYICLVYRSECPGCNGQLPFLENRGVQSNRSDGHIRPGSVHRMDTHPDIQKTKE